MPSQQPKPYEARHAIQSAPSWIGRCPDILYVHVTSIVLCSLAVTVFFLLQWQIAVTLTAASLPEFVQALTDFMRV